MQLKDMFDKNIVVTHRCGVHAQPTMRWFGCWFCFVLVYWFPPLGGGVFADGRVCNPLLQALLGPVAALLTLA